MRVGRAAAALALATLTGCAGMDYGTCVAVATGTGAALGGIGGGLIASEAVNHGDESAGSTNWEIAGGTGAGVVAGGLIGWAISNAVCEEAPPPPPPPPARTPPPPPPPLPPERRGG